MPLNKGPVSAVAAVATPPVAAAPVAAAPVAAAVAEKPKARSLKTKAADPVEAAVASVAQTAAVSVKSLQPKTLDEKSKQIQKQGIWQAVVQSNALVQYAPTLDAFLDLVDKASDRGLQYVNSER